jgi:hypothetical protein
VPTSAGVTVRHAAVDLAEVAVSLREPPEPAPMTPTRPDPIASAEPPAAAAAPAGRGKHARNDPAEEPLPPPPPPAPGRGRRSLANDEDALGTEAMLALLAAESSKPLHGLAGRLDSNASRVGVMAGGIVLFSALLFVVMAVIGSLI